MANANEYYPFGTGTGALVLTNAAYQALASRVSGFSDGVADPATLNVVWRQASVVAAMIAQFTADYGPSNVNDDGNVSTLENQFIAALSAALTSAPAPGIPYEGTDTGTANAMFVSTTRPVVTSLAAGQVFLITKSVSPNTGTVTLVIGSSATVPVVHTDGSNLQSGDWPASGVGLVYYTGTVFQLLTPPYVSINVASIWHTGTAGGTSSAILTTLAQTPPSGSSGFFIGLAMPTGLTNVANATLDFGFGAKPLVINAGAIAVLGGELAANSEVILFYDGTSVRVVSGSNLNTGSTPVASYVAYRVFTSSGTFTVDAACSVIEVIGCWGGGGGGGNGSNGFAVGAGGGGAGFAAGVFAVTPGSSISIAVGAGGAGSTTGGVAAGTGGTSQVGSLCTAGGGGGSLDNTPGAGGAASTNPANQLAIAGNPGSAGYNSFGNVYVGTGGNAWQTGRGLPGGIGQTTTAQANGQFPAVGGGGGGNVAGPNGAAGAPGIVIIKQIIGG